MKPFIIILILAVLVMAYLQWQSCNNKPVDNFASTQHKIDSFNKIISLKDGRIDTLTGDLLDANSQIQAAQHHSDSISRALDESKITAGLLAHKVQQARFANDTLAYIKNCNELAQMLTDSLNTLYRVIGEYQESMTELVTKWSAQGIINDSLRSAIIEKNRILKIAFDTAANGFKNVYTDWESVNRPRWFIGLATQLPIFGIGPQLLYENGNKIYHVAAFSNNNYQVGVAIRLSFKKFHL